MGPHRAVPRRTTKPILTHFDTLRKSNYAAVPGRVAMRLGSTITKNGLVWNMAWFDLDGIAWWGLLLLILAAFGAGWIDAVIGGGGLIQLPALLLIPGITPVQALATNKLASVFGTATSSITYARKVRPPIRSILPIAGVAFLAAIGGASFAAYLPASVIRPIIIVALCVVLAVTILKPSLGAVSKLKHSARHQVIAGLLIGLVIGTYDGVMGPGTGTFLVISLVAFIGLDFLEASAQAKIINFATNVGALLLFIPLGAVVWKTGLFLAAANALGAFLGARTALAKGTKFIRLLFVIVVAALIIKLGYDVLISGGTQG